MLFMRAKHLFEEHIYVISNFVVAKNYLFLDKRSCRRFLEKIDLYLSPICKIYNYYINVDQFHLIVRLNDRQAFENYYRNKKSDSELASSEIPHESYIFSQAMANLQSSAAIHFNRNNGRKGAIFARRFQKHLVESKTELERWLKKFNCWNLTSVQGVLWRYKLKRKAKKSKVERRMDILRSGVSLYEDGSQIHQILRSFCICQVRLLQGQFDKITLISLKTQKPTILPP
jgi:hypothetical protein